MLAIFSAPGWSSARGQQTLQVLHNHLRREVSNGSARFVGAMREDERVNFSIVLMPDGAYAV